MIREQNVLYLHQKWYQNSYFGSFLTYQINLTCLTSTSTLPKVWRLIAEFWLSWVRIRALSAHLHRTYKIHLW